ncbi:hypothetical protein HYW40_00655 [Candidatus Curtissbacteria bacterium]|nr:hypothetical protein [Candidatus Curtissbacteria bacterium]
MLERCLAQVERKALAYDPYFDVIAYRNLARSQASLPPYEYERRKNQLYLRTKHNLETEIGERLKVEISQVNYRLLDSKLISEEHDEPFEEIVRRGRNWRLRNGNPIDSNREQAELEGFQKAQKILAESTPDTKVVLISPRGSDGSDYKHNFFDIYEKDGAEVITMSRYVSRNTYQDFWEQAQKIDPSLPTPIGLSDAFFLTHPLMTLLPKEKILAMFTRDPKILDFDKYRKIIEGCQAFIKNYLRSPSENTYKAIINLADELAGYRQRLDLKLANIDSIIDHYAAQTVRTVATGCGFSGNSKSYNRSPWSVAEFGQGQEWFTCPKCQYKASGPVGDSCPNCHLTKEEYAKEAAVC